MSIREYIRYRKHRNSHIKYYSLNYLSFCLLSYFSQCKREKILSQYARLNPHEQKYVLDRVNYYNKLPEKYGSVKTEDNTMRYYPLSELKIHGTYNGNRARTVYVFDTWEIIRYFKQSYKAGFLFGDVTQIPPVSCFVKSRPIKGENENSVVLNMEKVRHFMFIKNDRKQFQEKKNMLIGRAFINQSHRKKFYEMYFGHPMCDLGNANKKMTEHPEWHVNPMSVDEHLDYKFILALEGNDVASNLKWIMSSNSLAVMPEPTYETWFMEGKLIPNYHYMKIKSDYSDLEERMKYYIAHPDEANEIIRHAHEYIKQFFNKKRERLIGLMVANKYFVYTRQKQ